MNKAFELILEELEDLREYLLTTNTEYNSHLIDAMMRVGKIVQEVAEEYNNGWIPCSERLPEDDSICIVTVEYPNNETVVDYGWFDRIGVCWYVGMQEFRTSNIIAWQPLPLPYKERD